MQLTINASYYKPDTKCWLRVFRAGMTGSILKGELSTQFVYRDAFPPDGEAMYVWVYVLRKFSGSTHTDAKNASSALSGGQSGFSGRLVLEEETLSRMGTAKICGSGTFDLKDVENGKVGTIEIIGWKSTVKECKRDVSALPDGNAWLAKVQTITPKESNITELPYKVFGSVKFPDCVLPSWGFPWRVYLNSHDDVHRMMQLNFEAACWLMRVDPKRYHRQPLDTKLEINATMQGMITACLIYARDSSLRMDGDRLIDDWTLFEHYPQPELLEFDCEDGAVHALAESTLLQCQWSPTDMTPFNSAAALEKRYLTAFAIVTLKLGDGAYTYHAVCMKFPERTLRTALGLRTIQLPIVTTDDDEKDLPVILVESTAWTVSNWRYKSRACTHDIYDAVMNQSDSLNAKVPAPEDKKHTLYIHACSLMIPNLMKRDKIGQIQLTYNGKFGVPMHLVMSGSFSEFEMTPVYLDPSDLDRLTDANLQAPLTRSLPDTYDPSKLIPRDPNRIPVAEFIVRMHDWNQNVARITETAKKMGGSTVEVQELNLEGGISGMCVSVYS